MTKETFLHHEAHVWYLFHSGFAIKTPNHFIVFDYYKDTPVRQPPCLETGVINPSEIQNNAVLVFSSHSHYDHFNPTILKWRTRIKDITYILSSDIKEKQADDILFVSQGNHYDVNGVQVDVLGSTDIGVSFLVGIDGLTIFHSGDLNWWHWKEASENENLQMKIGYKTQIDLLKGKKIDLAFIPVDPRLEEFYMLSLDYFMKTAGAAMVFPMHFSDNFLIFEMLKRDASTKDYYTKIVNITHRGQQFIYKPV